MKLTSKMKPVMLLIGAVTLSAVSFSALAQRDDQMYRRGYDDGYRAGQASVQVQSPGYFDGIQIRDASYGDGPNRCDARNSLQGAVEGRRSADILANNDLCGDPAENRVKTLSVTYSCGNSAPLNTRVIEGQVMAIRCR